MVDTSRGPFAGLNAEPARARVVHLVTANTIQRGETGRIPARRTVARMDVKRQETPLEQSRRSVREAEDRITRLTRLIADVLSLGKPVEHLEGLLDEHQKWLRPAQQQLMRQEAEEARNKPTDTE